MLVKYIFALGLLLGCHAWCGNTTAHAQPPDTSVSPSDETITLEAQDIEISELLEQVASQTSVSIAMSNTLENRHITVSWHNVPIEDALRALARSVNHTLSRHDDVFHLKPIRTHQTCVLPLDPLSVKLFAINHVSADTLLHGVKNLLTAQGEAQVDTRTNTLIVKDVEQNLEAVEILIEALDVPCTKISWFPAVPGSHHCR